MQPRKILLFSFFALIIVSNAFAGPLDKLKKTVKKATKPSKPKTWEYTYLTNFPEEQFRIKSVNTSKYIDLAGRENKTGNLQISNRQNTNDQIWQAFPTGEDGWFILKTPNNGFKQLRAEHNGKGAHLLAAENNGTPVRFIKKDDDTFYLMLRNEMFIDVSGGKSNAPEGTPVIAWTRNLKPNQQWKIILAGSEVVYNSKTYRKVAPPQPTIKPVVSKPVVTTAENNLADVLNSLSENTALSRYFNKINYSAFNDANYESGIYLFSTKVNTLDTTDKLRIAVAVLNSMDINRDADCRGLVYEELTRIDLKKENNLVLNMAKAQLKNKIMARKNAETSARNKDLLETLYNSI